MKNMTARQIQKLENILAKLEALQNEVTDLAMRDQLGCGKNELLRALRMSSK